MTGLARAPGHRSLSRFALLILTMATTVCGKDATGPDDALTPVGAWTLVLVDGEPLPAQVFLLTDVDKSEVLSGQLSINADGTCSLSLTVRITYGDNVITGDHGSACTWTRDNNVMTFAFPSGPTHSASWSGDTLTLTMIAVDFVFER